MVRKLKTKKEDNTENMGISVESLMGGLLKGALGGAMGEITDKLKPELDEVVEVPQEFFEDRTKHFLFYSGGTDSTLILEDILVVMEHNKRDKLVLMIVKDEFLGSGKANRIQDTLEALKKRMDLLRNTKKDVYNRIRLNVFDKSTIGVGSNAPNVVFPEKDMPKQSYFFANKTRQFNLQELLLLNHTYNIVLLSECCRNRVYLGQNGGDLGNANFDRLDNMFNEKVSFMMKNMLNEGFLNSQILDIKKKRANNMSIFDAELIKNVIPTLEFPLKNTKKEQIMDRLKNEYPHASYDISTKAEDLTKLYAEELQEEVQHYHGLMEKMEVMKVEHEGVMPFGEYVRNNCEKFYYVDKSGKKLYQDEAFMEDAKLHAMANMMKRTAVAAGIL